MATTVPSVETLMNGIITPDGFEREETVGENWHPNPEYRSTFPVLKLTSPDTRIEIHFTTGKYRRTGYDLGSGHVTFDTPMGERTFDRYGVEDSFYIDNPLKDYELKFWHGDRVCHGLGAERVSEPLTDLRDPHLDDLPNRGVGAVDDVRALHLETLQLGLCVLGAFRRVGQVAVPEDPDRPDALAALHALVGDGAANSEKVPQLPFTVTPETKAKIAETLRGGGIHRFVPSGFGTGYALSTQRSRWAEQSTVLARFFGGVHVVYVEKFDAD